MTIDKTVNRPALRYHGSKFRMAPWIVSFFPEHDVYCEPFGGGAGVLLRKERSHVEIYNDLDTEVINLFRVLRTSPRELAQAIALTPFSREEYHSCFEPTDDPIERARRLVSRSFFGFGSHSHNILNSNNGFRTARSDYKGRGMRVTHGSARTPRLFSYAAEWVGIPDALMKVSERFSGVTIELLDAFKLIPKYDGPAVLFYLDPPYVHTSRNDATKGYSFELSDQQHLQLANLLKSIKGKAIISGYDTPLYREAYADWRREEKSVMANGQLGATPRTEVIWMNF